MPTIISSTEAARHLGDYLARVKHKGECFILTKNNQPLAELSPAPRNQGGSLRQLLELTCDLPRDETFARDLEKANSQEPPQNPWG